MADRLFHSVRRWEQPWEATVCAVSIAAAGVACGVTAWGAGGAGGCGAVWGGMGVGLGALALNRQFGWLARAAAGARDYARRTGRYHSVRRPIQFAATAGLGLIAAGVVWAMWRGSGRCVPDVVPAALPAVLLAALTAARAVSLHELDQVLLRTVPVGPGARVNTVVEVGLAVWVVWGALGGVIA